MKICYLIPDIHTFGGIQRVQSTLSNELCKQHEVYIYSVSGDKRDTLPFEYSNTVVIRKLHLCRNRFLEFTSWAVLQLNRRTDIFKPRIFHTDWFYRLFTRFFIVNKSCAKRLSDEINNEKFDIVVAVTWVVVVVGQIADKINSKTIAWQRNDFNLYFRTKGFHFYNFEKLFMQNLTKLNQTVVLQNEMKQDYYKYLGIDSVIINNPCSLVCSKKSDMSNHHFVSVGSFRGQKGYELLVDSFRIFAEEDNEWNLTIVAGGRLQSEIENQIRKYGLTGRVNITGYVKSIEKYLLEASIFLMPSRAEGHPNVVLEAMEAGLPIIAYNIPSISEVVTHELEGLLVNPFDTVEFATSMKQLAQNEIMRKQMSEQSAKKAKYFTVENIAYQWESLFEKMLTDDKQ